MTNLEMEQSQREITQWTNKPIDSVRATLLESVLLFTPFKSVLFTFKAAFFFPYTFTSKQNTFSSEYCYFSLLWFHWLSFIHNALGAFGVNFNANDCVLICNLHFHRHNIVSTNCKLFQFYLFACLLVSVHALQQHLSV